MITRRERLLFALLTLVGAFLITRGLIAGPGFTDVFYHLNAATRLASGQGLTDVYLWTYIGAPETLPAPSHLYWLPLTSLLAGAGMALLNAPGDYAAAQWPFTLLFAATIITGFGLGERLGGTRRHAWTAGLLTLFSGFFTRFWGAVDTFAPYALVGALALLCIGWASSSLQLPAIIGRQKTEDLTAEAQSSTEEYRGRWVGRDTALPYPPHWWHMLRTGTTDAGRGYWLACIGTGVFSGLAHLTRADGVLLLMVGWAALLWPNLTLPLRNLTPTLTRVARSPLPGASENKSISESPLSPRRGDLGVRFSGLALMTLAYLLVMSPWFVRNLREIGSVMPLGGAQGIWFREYNDIFSYPPDASPATLFADGADAFVASRWEALTNNLGTFIAVEGWVVLAPLMLLGLWTRRRDAFLRGFWLYALGLHLVMTLIFPFPGYRGGLLHSAAALVPWWAALGVVGLDAAVEWVARRRRRWNAVTAKRIFSAGLVGAALLLSLMIALPNRVPPPGLPALYRDLRDLLPADARVMINDPAQLYYFTGLGGVVLPNETPDVIPQIARQYGVRYLLLEGVTADGLPSAAPRGLWSLVNAPPEFLVPVPLLITSVRLYEIRY